ncbi:hypothetical protein ABIH81_14960 [Micromonospora sp. HUAS YX12]|uniref:Uncharacterized protein n=1 Tax=Micromonospora sp. HUAS YX12 TaxID=3156396 RepID=A0AAU7R8D9_9ACTN
MALDIFEGKGFNGATLAVAVLALLVAGVAAYFAREALFPPKRRITIHVLTPVRLLTGARVGLEDVEVSRRGRVLPDPHVITILIRNTGRHAVASEQFDQGRPLTIDLQSPIEALLNPAGGQAPSGVVVEGTSVCFGPELVRRKQEIPIQVLASEWGDPEITLTEHLVDTECRVQLGGFEQPRVTRRAEAVATASASVGVTVSIIALVNDLLN